MTVADPPLAPGPAPRDSGVRAGRVGLPPLEIWRNRASFWFTLALVCAGSGALYGIIEPEGRPGIGALYGFVVGGAVSLFERGAILPRLRTWLLGLPLVPSVLLTELTYVALIMVGNLVTGTLTILAGLDRASTLVALFGTPATLLYALAVSGFVITLLRMRDLIGAEVFRNILLGRYHRPVEEERIFAFIDLVGSTAYAQAHGDLRAQAFLSAIFAVLAAPVRRHGGSIDDYVGDMAMVTWPMRRGTRGARCIACVADFLAAIEADRDQWMRRFGQVPTFRVALHGGGVVTAEIGVDRHKIAYFGDVVNTTGRLEGLCRTLKAPVLISADLLGRLPDLPPGIMARPLGQHAAKGRGQLLSVLALERVGRPPLETRPA